MIYKSFFLLCSFILWSCEQQSEEIIVSARNNKVYINTPSHSNNSQTTLDWDGSYTGVLSCDGCDDIGITLTLNLDHTYKFEVLRLSNDEYIEIEKGSFNWNDEGNEIILNNKYKDRYLIEKEKIYQLDKEGNIIDNKPNELLVLTKND